MRDEFKIHHESQQAERKFEVETIGKEREQTRRQFQIEILMMTNKAASLASQSLF